MIDVSKYTNKSLEELRPPENWQDRRKGDTSPVKYDTPVEYSIRKSKEISYLEICNVFKLIWRHNLKIEKPIIHPGNEIIIREILKWISNDPECKLERRKGVYLVGEYGSGKTQLMNSIKETGKVINETHHQTFRKWLSVGYRGLKKASEEEFDGYMKFYNRFAICIDDLGYEEDAKTSRVNKMGTVSVVVQELVRSRYELWQRTNAPTHFTSNKSIEEIRELYGAGTSTRLQEMCHQLHWKGENLRN